MRRENSLRGVVNFYAYDEEDKPKGILDLLARLVHRALTPRFRHCSLTVAGSAFDYGRDGYRVGLPGKTPDEEIEVQIVNPTVLLDWDRQDQPWLCSLRIALSPLLPTRNCSSVIGEMLDLRARTPDKLYEQLRGEAD